MRYARAQKQRIAELEAERDELLKEHQEARKAFADIAGWSATDQHRKVEDLASTMVISMAEVQP